MDLIQHPSIDFDRKHTHIARGDQNATSINHQVRLISTLWARAGTLEAADLSRRFVRPVPLPRYLSIRDLNLDYQGPDVTILLPVEEIPNILAGGIRALGMAQERFEGSGTEVGS